MFDKQMFKQLEKLMGQMTPAQKEKIESFLKDEESLKKAISNIDPKKAKQAVENFRIEGFEGKDLGKMAEELTKNPEVLQKKGPFSQKD